jgi:hypothetical protein
LNAIVVIFHKGHIGVTEDIGKNNQMQYNPPCHLYEDIGNHHDKPTASSYSITTPTPGAISITTPYT